MSIDWLAFGQVFLAALAGAAVLVGLYSLGLRLLVTGGRPPVVPPQEFPDAITVMSEKARRKAERKAEKAAQRVPLTDRQKRTVLSFAYLCFGLCACAIVGAVLVIFLFH
ncbi:MULTISPECIES: peptidase [Brevibacterium]|jgi:hypothetical protein|uniref:Peptidase n=1 Tax=Brevibacterium salitolerans TaxID=1403566 RepID=A0ABP5I130_9MICO|nr:peptidase [Brevibacterium sp.]